MTEAIVPNKKGKGRCAKHKTPSTHLKIRLYRGKAVDRKRICEICREEWINETVRRYNEQNL